jgi:GNAT superfamily N-acetyltransferase
MGNYPIIIEKNPASEDLCFLMQKLHEYNVSQTGREGDLLSIFLKDGEQQIIGGLHGWTAFNYLHIDVLWLREDLRRQGYGRCLMQVAEEEALRRGCRYAQAGHI